MKKRVVIIGGGMAGLAAAYTLRNRDIDVLLFEANDRMGGRAFGEVVDGFHIDAGTDFFCSSYDVAFRICKELGLPLLRSKMNLGWYKNGRWSVSALSLSPRSIAGNLATLWNLDFVSPRGFWPFLKFVRDLRRQQEYLNFSSEGRIAEIDGEESFGDYLNRIGAPDSLKVTIEGFLKMTMGHVEHASEAYMRTYFSEMFMKANQIYVPEKGACTLSYALAGACEDVVRTSTPVQRVIRERERERERENVAKGVIVDGGLVEADAVICAVPATKVPDIIPDLPAGVRRVLGGVTYSSGCRVVIGLDRPPLPLGWHGALYPEDETPLLLDRSINLPACAPAGKNTLDLLVGRDRAEELIPMDDEEIRHRMLQDARRNPPPGSDLPNDDEGLFTRVYRWKEAVCMMQPGMFTAIANMRDELDQSVENLFLAGDYMRVPSVNGALASGVDAANEAARYVSKAAT